LLYKELIERLIPVEEPLEDEKDTDSLRWTERKSLQITLEPSHIRFGTRLT